MTWFWGYNDILRQEPNTLAYCLRLRQLSGLYLWPVVTWADLFLVLSFDLIQRRIQGRAFPPPLFFDQNDDRRVEKKFLETAPHPHLSQGLDDRPPPIPSPLSDGLDQPLWLKSWGTGNATQHPEDNRTDSLALLWLVNLNSEDKWGTTGTSQSDPLTTIYGQLHGAFWLKDNHKTKHI